MEMQKRAAPRHRPLSFARGAELLAACPALCHRRIPANELFTTLAKLRGGAHPNQAEYRLLDAGCHGGAELYVLGDIG